ncbi:hypothetical protein ACP4OV_027291 [Aristida adscensionis]
MEPIRRRSPAPTDDQIERVMHYCGGRTLASRDRAIAWLSSRARLIDEEPSAAATLCYMSPRPAVVVLRPREVMPPPVTARRPHMLPWWDYLTHILCMVGGDDPVFMTVYALEHEPGYPTLFPVQYRVTFKQIWWPWADVTTIMAIGEFHPADCVAKRSAVQAMLKDLWWEAGIAVADCESFKHSSDWIDNSFFLAQPSRRYILRYVADRLSYTVRCPAPVYEFGGCTKLYQPEVKFVGQIPERRNFSVLGTIENCPYLAILTALLQARLYLETHEGADIVDVNRA